MSRAGVIAGVALAVAGVMAAHAHLPQPDMSYGSWSTAQHLGVRFQHTLALDVRQPGSILLHSGGRGRGRASIRLKETPGLCPSWYESHLRFTTYGTWLTYEVEVTPAGPRADEVVLRGLVKVGDHCFFLLCETIAEDAELDPTSCLRTVATLRPADPA